MTAGPATVGPADPASAAKSLLESRNIHHLPVVENGKLVGIISSSDLLKIQFPDNGSASHEDVTVARIMTANPVVLDAQASLRDAATKLLQGRFHALPVVNPDRTLVGIVTTSDLIDHLLHQIPTGDGSIETPEKTDSASDPDEGEISEALREAEQAVDHGGRASKLTRVLLYIHKRNRLLQDACKAAELYVRSGHGEHEHAVLVKRLLDVHGRAKRTDL